MLRPKHRDLPLKTKNAAVHIGLVQKHADIVYKIARWKVVSAVDQNIIGLRKLQRIGGRKDLVVRDHLDIRIEVQQALAGGVNFERANLRSAMNDLALQIVRLDHIVVHQSDAAHTGCRKVQRHRRPQPARADAQHAGSFQALLSSQRHLRHD